MTTTSNPARPSAPVAQNGRAMYIGLGLTVLATLAPLLDVATVDTLSKHVRDAYPAWGPDLVAGDRNAMVLYLVITGGLGILAWLWTIRAVRAGKRRAHIATTIAFAAGATVALLNLTAGGGAYDLVLPAGYGVLTLLPCLAGVVVVVSVWRRRPMS